MKTNGIGWRIAVGAVAGLAWAGALRAYMSEITGGLSTFTWVGTFVGVLLPGAIVGGALGAASVLPASGRGRFALKCCAAAPLAFAIFPMLLPGQLWALVTTGLGGGAVGVSLGGLAGGYAIGGGRRWARIGCGILAAVIVIGVAATVPSLGGSALAISAPRGAWMTLLVTTLLIVLAVACSIPFRRLQIRPGNADTRRPALPSRRYGK